MICPKCGRRDGLCSAGDVIDVIPDRSSFPTRIELKQQWAYLCQCGVRIEWVENAVYDRVEKSFDTLTGKDWIISEIQDKLKDLPLS